MYVYEGIKASTALSAFSSITTRQIELLLALMNGTWIGRQTNYRWAHCKALGTPNLDLLNVNMKHTNEGSRICLHYRGIYSRAWAEQTSSGSREKPRLGVVPRLLTELCWSCVR